MYTSGKCVSHAYAYLLHSCLSYVAYAVCMKQIFDFFPCFASQFMWLFVCMCACVCDFEFLYLSPPSDNEETNNTNKRYQKLFQSFRFVLDSEHNNLSYRYSSISSSHKNRFCCKIWHSIAKFMLAILLEMTARANISVVCVECKEERNEREQW